MEVVGVDVGFDFFDYFLGVLVDYFDVVVVYDVDYQVFVVGGYDDVGWQFVYWYGLFDLLGGQVDGVDLVVVLLGDEGGGVGVVEGDVVGGFGQWDVFGQFQVLVVVVVDIDLVQMQVGGNELFLVRCEVDLVGIDDVVQFVLYGIGFGIEE